MAQKDLPPGISARGTKFRVSIMVDGVRRTATCDTLDEAKDRAAAFREQPAGKAKVAPLTLQQGVDTYIAQVLRPQSASENTIKGYTYRGTALAHFLGGSTLLDEITSGDVFSMVERMREERDNGPSTLRATLNVLGCVMRHARKVGGMVRTIPDFPSVKTRKSRVRYITYEDEAEILDHLESESLTLIRDIVICLVDTGLRVGELLGIPWRDVDLDNRRVHVWDGKSAEPRAVPMTQRVFSTLARLHLARAKQVGPFHDTTYQRFNKAWVAMRLALGRDKNTFTPHILRHTFCTRLVSNGVELVTVKNLAGHANIETTMIYAHFIPARMGDAIGTLDRATARAGVVDMRSFKSL